MEEYIRKIEEISINAHPTLNTYIYDNWMLRFAQGYTDRANSVQMLNASTISLEEKITYCEKMYQEQGLPTTFKVTPLSKELDGLLEQRGYEMVTPTNIMKLMLNRLPESLINTGGDVTGDGVTGTDTDDLKVVIETEVTETWEKINYQLKKTTTQNQSIARQIQHLILPQTIYATIYAKNEAVASGMCVVDQGYVGLYEIIVSETARRRGYGYRLCCELLKSAKEHGATEAYLQVVDANENAKKLYRKLGYTDVYHYWYRKK